MYRSRSGLALVHPADLDRLADRDLGERRAGQFVNGAVGGGDRIAVRIDARVAQRRRHPLDQRVRHGVLQPLGLVVDGVPGVTEEGDEIGLDQPVPPDGPQGRPPALLGELDALVGDMLQQPVLATAA